MLQWLNVWNTLALLVLTFVLYFMSDLLMGPSAGAAVRAVTFLAFFGLLLYLFVLIVKAVVRKARQG